MKQTEGIIFLAENRVKNQFGASTLSESICVSDIYLDASSTFSNTSDQSVLIIPFIGDINFEINNEQHLVEENQIIFYQDLAKPEFKIKNPYPDDTINFYEILIDKNFFSPNIVIKSADIQNQKNQLLEITEKIKIGQYELRNEGTYILKKPDTKLFVYAISGAFEAQNRLIQPHDALLLWNLEKFEFEALSNDAVILIIELCF